MGRKHSKGSGDKYYHLSGEKAKMDQGTLVQRLGSDSQLPWGYCPFSLNPIVEGVVSPSGNLYSREGIVEYLLNKTRDIKAQKEAYDRQEEAKRRESEAREMQASQQSIQSFVESLDGVASVIKRKSNDISSEAHDGGDDAVAERRRRIDDRSKEEKHSELSKVAVWLPQFTPTAASSAIKEPPKRPSSPFSGQELRAKDLSPIDLVSENSDNNSSSSSGGTKRFICPVSRKTITNQPVIFIKSTGSYMLETAAKELAYGPMVCPTTGKPFAMKDVIKLTSAASGFSSSGSTTASIYRPTIV